MIGEIPITVNATVFIILIIGVALAIMGKLPSFHQLKDKV